MSMSQKTIGQPRELLDGGAPRPTPDGGGDPKLHGRLTRKIRGAIGEAVSAAHLTAAEERAVREVREREALRPAYDEARRRLSEAEADVFSAERELDRRVLALLLDRATEEQVRGASEELDAARRRVGWYERAEAELKTKLKARLR